MKSDLILHNCTLYQSGGNNVKRTTYFNALKELRVIQLVSNEGCENGRAVGAQ